MANSVLRNPCSRSIPRPRSVAKDRAAITSAAGIRSPCGDAPPVTARQYPSPTREGCVLLLLREASARAAIELAALLDEQVRCSAPPLTPLREARSKRLRGPICAA